MWYLQSQNNDYIIRRVPLGAYQARLILVKLLAHAEKSTFFANTHPLTLDGRDFELNDLDLRQISNKSTASAGKGSLESTRW